MAAPPAQLAPGRDPFAAPIIVPGDRRPALPHSLDAEEAVIGGCIIRNDIFRDIHLAADDFFDPRHQAVWRAMAAIDSEGEPIDEVTIAATLQAERLLERAGGRAYLDHLGLRVPTADNARHYAGIVADLATRRRLMEGASRLVEMARHADIDALQAEIARLDVGRVNGKANGKAHPAAEKKPVAWFNRSGVVGIIRERSTEPWVDVGLGNDTITRVRAGGLVTLAGPSGAGKTSLAAAIAQRHAHDFGWVLIISRELTVDEIGARMIGQRLGRTWEEVLTGQVPDDEMLDALPERMRIIDGEDATLTTLDDQLGQLRSEGISSEPILTMVDYGQIISEDNDDQRIRAINAWTRLDSILRRRRAVGLMLSQMSRQNSKAARAGERLGADAMDGGAESAAIERYSTVVLEIGATGQDDEHGRREMLLSVGKGRMGGGDKVWPLQYTGTTGHVIVSGVAKPAAEVRAEREAQVNDNKLGVVVRALRDTLGETKKPISRSDLIEQAGVNKKLGLAGIKRMLSTGDAVEVKRKPPRARYWMLWTRNQAEAGRLEIVVEEEGGSDAS